MLIIVLTSLLLAIPLYSSTITPTLFTRITSITLLFSAAISFNGLYVKAIGYGLGLYSGLFHVTTVTQTIEVFLFLVAALILLGYANELNNMSLGVKKDPLKTAVNISEYPLIILFTTIGATFLISSSDLVSMYLSIELQSFAVYILAAIYRNSESATSAGLKYFLLGALSSALILLGSSLIYAYTGLTNIESIYMFTNVLSPVTGVFTDNNKVTLGLLIIGIGFLFKVAAAPFHNWAPDVYDGVPTIVTTWLTVMPKISIFVFLLEIISLLSTTDQESSVWKTLLLTTALLSLVIGTVVGLSQYRLKRLLAYSTISHVGFLLLALSVNSEDSIGSFLFYLLQYSLTNLNTFFVVLAFGYILYESRKKTSTDISFISELKGQFLANPTLGFSLALCLFSMAGIPPLLGFFAKYLVLYSAIENGYYFLALIGILASVVSASYYLRVIKVVFMDNSTKDVIVSHSDKDLNKKLSDYSQNYIGNSNNDTQVLSSAHSYVISVLTLLITLFILSPSLLLNSSNLLALSLFTA